MNVTSLFCTQKLKIPENITNSANPISFVGKIPNSIWSLYKQRIGFPIDDEFFFGKYSSRIGKSKSNNILFIDASQQLVHFNKVSEDFATIWKPIFEKHKKNIEYKKK